MIATVDIMVKLVDALIADTGKNGAWAVKTFKEIFILGFKHAKAGGEINEHDD